MLVGPSITMDTMNRRAAIYARVSLDRDERSASPEQQERLCRSEAERRGWSVVDVFTDRDVSAYAEGVSRPEHDRMLDSLRSGRINAVLVWKVDRLTRQGISGLWGLLDLLRQSDAVLVSVTEPFIDMDSAMGEAFLGFVASQAKQESQNTSARVKRAHAASAAEGRMHSGGSRQFGYTRDGEIIEDEADVVREVSERVLAGDSVRSIAVDLNNRGVRPTGRRRLTAEEKLLPLDERRALDRRTQWRAESLRQMIKSPRIAGLRRHNGTLHEGTWEPILDRERHESVLAALSGSSSVKKTVRRHLLTGLTKCGRCGCNLKTMGFRMKNGRKFERYQCAPQPGSRNCGGLAIAKNSLDDYVVGEVLRFLERAKLKPLEGEDGEEQLARLVAEDEAALRELTRARFVERTLSDDAFQAARVELDDRLVNGKQALAAVRRRKEDRRSALDLNSIEDLRAWWDDVGIEERRELVHTALSEIVIRPAKHRGGNKLDLDRVQLRWNWNLFMAAAERFEEVATDEDRRQAVEDYQLLVARTGP